MTGFTGNGTVCGNIDECLTGAHTCDRKATCEDTAGNFSCTCLSGYTSSGFQCSAVGKADNQTGQKNFPA